MHFQGLMIHFSLKNEALKNETVKTDKKNSNQQFFNIKVEWNYGFIIKLCLLIIFKHKLNYTLFDSVVLS